MKKYLGLIPVAIFAILLGCGGGGGGGGSTNGTNVSTTGFTSGDTTASAGSTILGQAINQSNGGVGGVTVKFYNSGGSLVGSAVSRANGYFDANLPTSATRFEVDEATFPTNSGIAKQYYYDEEVYQATGAGLPCNRILLPALTEGVLTPMAGPFIFYNAGTVPPLPEGCF